MISRHPPQSGKDTEHLLGWLICLRRSSCTGAHVSNELATEKTIWVKYYWCVIEAIYQTWSSPVCNELGSKKQTRIVCVACYLCSTKYILLVHNVENGHSNIDLHVNSVLFTTHPLDIENPTTKLLTCVEGTRDMNSQYQDEIAPQIFITLTYPTMCQNGRVHISCKWITHLQILHIYFK